MLPTPRTINPPRHLPAIGLLLGLVFTASAHAQGPKPPTSQSATALSSSAIQISWTPAKGGTKPAGYAIERSLTNVGPFTLVATVSANATTYTNTGLNSATTYHYRVGAFSGSNTNYTTGTASATTFEAPPNPPSNLTATAVATNQINLTWTDNSHNETGFHIERAPAATGPFTPIATTAANVTTFANTGLSASTTYHYRLRATNSAGNSDYSNVASATTPSAPDTTPPSVPTGLVATAVATNQINLTWNASSDTGGSGLAGYRVYRGGVLIATVSTTSYSDTGRAPATQYCYTVAAYDNAGNASAHSGPACATTPSAPDTTPPSVPTGLVATAVATNQINLTWNASSDTGGSGLAGYRVYRGGVLIATVSTTSYSDTGRAPATQYCYTVAAYDNAGNASAHSGPACATTPSAPDTTPPTVTLTAPVNGAIVSNTIAITATASDNVGVTRVEFYRDGGVILGTNSSAPYSLTFDTRTISNGPCTFYAKAYDAAGNQATSAGNTVTVNNPVSLPTEPRLVGFLPSVGVSRAVTVGGTRAYVACDVYGLTVVDVATPTAPRVLGSSNIAFDGSWIAGTGATVVVTGVRTYHRLAGVATTVNGFYVLNATNPAAPKLVGMLETNATLVFKRVAVTGHYAYVACGGAGLRVINISNPAVPVIVGAFDTPGFAHGVAVAGNHAYVADDAAGLQILNISNPANPTFVSVVDTPGLASDVAVAGNFAYVADANAVQVVDISNPAAPRLLGSYPITAAYEIKAAGSIAYVGASGAGLVMINCSNPSAPAYLGAVLPIGAPDASTVGVAVQGNYAYVANRTGGLAIVNVANPSNASAVGQLMEWFAGFKIAHQPGQALVTGARYWNGGASSTSGFQLLNVTNPAQPFVVATYTNAALVFKGVALAGNRAYIACGGAGLRVFDISNPAVPTIIGSYDTPGFAQAVALAGNLAYIADDSAGLVILNISNPSAPVLVSVTDTPGLASDVAVAGNHAYIADANALRIYDVANPAAPIWRGTYALNAAYDVKVTGTTAYVSANSGGLVIIGVSNPALPTLLGTILPTGATGASTVSVAINNATAYVCNRTGGLAVYNVTNPGNPVLLGSVLTTGDARAAVYSNQWVFVADSFASINTIQVP